MTALILLFGLAFLVSVDIRILTPVLPSISASLGATPGVVGLAMTSFSDFLRSGRAQAVYLAVFLEGFLLWGSATYLAAFGTHRHDLDQFSVGLLIALLGAGTVASGLCMARVRHWLSENALAASGGTLMGAAFVLLIPHWSWPALAASTFLLGLGYAALHTTLQLRGTEISSTARGKAFSLFVFSLFAGNATGTAAFGWLVDAGRYELAFAISAGGLVAVGLGTALAGRYPKR